MPYIPAGPLRMGIFPITERSGLHWSRMKQANLRRSHCRGFELGWRYLLFCLRTKEIPHCQPFLLAGLATPALAVGVRTSTTSFMKWIETRSVQFGQVNQRRIGGFDPITGLARNQRRGDYDAFMPGFASHNMQVD